MNDEIKLIFENDFNSVNKWFKHDPFLVIRNPGLSNDFRETAENISFSRGWKSEEAI